MRENELLWCSCCGKGVRNNAEENVDYGKKPYPHDNEFGMCRECGGDPKAGGAKDWDKLNEKEVKKRLGWSTVRFVEARFALIRKNLSASNQTKFDKLPYWKKVAFALKMVEKGVIAW